MDLSRMERKELLSLQRDIDRELQRRQKQDRNEAYQKIRAIADEAGIPLDEIVGKSPKKGGGGSRSKVEPKFRDPKNPSNTWAGRGRKPRWLEDALKRGGKVEDFAI